MTFWLILITTIFGSTGSPTVMHIGNFSSLTSCEEFAKNATYPVVPASPDQDLAVIKMMCIQANDARSKPPAS